MLPKQKIVQSFISAFNQEVTKIEVIRIALNDYKTKWQTLNPDLTETNLDLSQAGDMNTFLTKLNELMDLSIVTTISTKHIMSHDVKGLD